MRILILSQYYAPEPLPKAQELAEGLLALGHTVTVLTGFPNYPHGSLYPGYRIKPWSTGEINGVRVIRLALYPDHSKSNLRRIANYASFASAASVLGTLLCGRADVMFVFHPPLTVGVAAWVISRLRGIPFVYGVADLWPEAIVASGTIGNRLVVRVLERLAKFIYARATVVAVVTPGMAEYLAHKNVAREKLHVIRDWADERLYIPRPRDAALAARLGTADKFNVVFGGYVGIAQRLDIVLDAADILKSHDRIQFLIVGDGVERVRLEREAAARGLANVRFVGSIPSAEMPRVYALADVLLVHLSAQPIFTLSVPSKVYAYMACARPVLMAVLGDAADVIRYGGAGLTCPPEDAAAMADAVLTFFRMPAAEREEFGRNARGCFLKEYSRSVILQKCVALLESVARMPERGRSAR